MAHSSVEGSASSFTICGVTWPLWPGVVVPAVTTCGENSSTGNRGEAILHLPNGDLHLTRLIGDACFTAPPPRVDVTESWRISGGTGAFTGASGTASRALIGDQTNGTSHGTWQGELHLPG